MALSSRLQPISLYKVKTPDGLTIAAQEWGDREGPEIVLIHGHSQSHLCWSRQFDGDLAKSFRIITYDIRGHGGSEKPLDAAFYRDARRWADELKSVIETAQLKSPVLVGWSYGSRIIAEYLMEYGDGQMAGINLVGAFTKLDRDLLGPAALAVFKMASTDLKENIANTIGFLKQCTAAPLSQDEFDVMLAYTMMVPAEIRGHLLGRPAPYEAALKKLSVPVLLSHGTDDRVARVAMVEYTQGVIQHAQVSLYRGVGHMPFWEDAPRFNDELARFVESCNET